MLPGFSVRLRRTFRMDWHSAVDSFVEMFTTMDFSSGPLFYVIGIVLAGYCCLEGYGIYKMVLGAVGFTLGFRAGYFVFSAIGLSGEALLMAETFLGLILMVVSYKIFLAGVFIAVFQLGVTNLPVYVEALLKEKVGNPLILTGVIVTIISVGAALIIAKLSVTMTRPVLVCLTSVIGGFAAINFLIDLIPVFPYEVELPPASSFIWILAKVFLAAAGVGIQGVKDPTSGVI